MSYLVLALKWRPQTFDEVAGQEAISQTLKNAIRTDRTAHAYLFTGPRGVGKTSTARILAKALNCAEGPTPEPCNRCDPCREITSGRSLDVLEIDGASNRGIDDIRELRESVRYAPASGRVKVYIIDEVHMLTADAFNALLKTLEEPPGHVLFVLATTEPLKVPATIVSRCQRYDFSRLRLRDTVQRMKAICEAEGVEVAEDALSLIGRRSEGSMRDALTLLDQVLASGRTPIDGPAVAEALGIAGRDLYFSLSRAMLDGDAHRALGLLGEAYADGQNLQEVAEELVAHLRNLLVLCLHDDLEDLVDATDSEREMYREQAGRTRPADLIRQLHIAIETAVRMRRSAFPRVLLEVGLAEICFLPRSADLAEWIRKLPAGGEQPPPGGGTGPRQTPASAPRESAAGAEAGRRSGSGGAEAAAGSTAGSAGSAEPEGDWDRVVHRVRSTKPALAATLAGSQLAGEEGGYLRIRLPASGARFGATALEQPGNRPVLQEAIREVFGKTLGWKVDATPAEEREGGPEREAGEPAGSRRPDPSASSETPPEGARSNLADVQRIADRLDGEILGPS